MSIVARPRAYTDWTVPKDQDGNDIGVCEDDATYRFYLEWLSDYLYETDIPVPECQRALLDEFRQENNVGHAVLDLSDCWGYGIWTTEDIEESAASGVSYQEALSVETRVWDELSESDQEEWGGKEEFVTSEEDFDRLGREFTESKKVPPHIKHADVAYRPVLAALFKDVHDPATRYRHLDYFYTNFGDCASK